MCIEPLTITESDREIIGPIENSMYHFEELLILSNYLLFSYFFFKRSSLRQFLSVSGIELVQHHKKSLSVKLFPHTDAF